MINIKGELFYSPNSSRTIESIPPCTRAGTELNPAHPKNNEREELHPFRDKITSLSFFHQPRWWTSRFGWVGFVPIHPHFHHSPFHCLSQLPKKLEKGVDYYRVPFWVRQKWHILQMELLFAAKAMVEHIKSPAIHPTLPETRGYKNRFLAPRFTMQAAENSRDWFVMWMGLLSYTVALANTKQASQTGYTSEDVPEWKTLMKKAGLSELWFETIPLNFDIYDYSYNTKRAGIILAFPPQTTDQPSPEWLNNHGIPFWYRLGKEEETFLKNTGLFDSIAPLPHQLQQAISPFLKQPSDMPFMHLTLHGHASTTNSTRTDETNSDFNTSPTPNINDTPPWKTFLLERAERNKAQLLKETIQEQRNRLAWEKAPPIKAKMFQWVKNDVGIRERIPVVAREKSDLLEFYGSKQKIFDSFAKEWDICSDFGPPDDMDEDDMNFTLDQNPEGIAPETDDALAEENKCYHQSFENRTDINSSTIEYSTTDIPPDRYYEEPGQIIEENNVFAERLEEECRELLESRFGFVMPIPYPTKPPPRYLPPSKEHSNFLRALGIASHPAAHPFFSTEIFKIFAEFVNELEKGKSASDRCDLTKNNFRSLAFSSRAQKIKTMTSYTNNNDDDPSKTWYVFDFEDKAMVKWKLAVKSAEDALTICRMDKDMNEVDIAKNLVTLGIPFHTIRPRRADEEQLRTISYAAQFTQLPQRHAEYEFSKQDFDEYVHYRTILLSQPRARAALLRGGLIWRLAWATLSVDATVRWPTGEGHMIMLGDGAKGIWCDDELTDVECNLICGTYIVQTGK